MPNNSAAIVTHRHEGATVLAQAREIWPPAVLVVGLLASAVWSLGLLYGAYLLVALALE